MSFDSSFPVDFTVSFRSSCTSWSDQKSFRSVIIKLFRTGAIFYYWPKRCDRRHPFKVPIGMDVLLVGSSAGQLVIVRCSPAHIH